MIRAHFVTGCLFLIRSWGGGQLAPLGVSLRYQLLGGMGRLFLRQLLFIHGSWGRIVWLHLWLLFINGSWGWMGQLFLRPLPSINAPGAG